MNSDSTPGGMLPATPEAEASARIAVVLVTRSAIAAAPREEMADLARRVAGLPGLAHATYAFTEQGSPSLRTVVAELRQSSFTEIRLVPLTVPTEPSFRAWTTRTLARWQGEWGDDGPPIRIAPNPNVSPAMADLVADLVDRAGHEPAFDPAFRTTASGSVVAAARRRVLVCRGGPCNEAGSAVIWGHLRNEQERLGLRAAAQGTMSATTSCLGPCGLAPWFKSGRRAPSTVAWTRLASTVSSPITCSATARLRISPMRQMGGSNSSAPNDSSQWAGSTPSCSLWWMARAKAIVLLSASIGRGTRPARASQLGGLRPVRFGPATHVTGRRRRSHF